MKKQDEKQLHSSAADFPVSHSQQPEHRKVLPIFVTSGLKWQELFPNCTPLGCLGRMLPALSVWGSTKRFLTWNAKDTLFKHTYIQLVASARGIGAWHERARTFIVAVDVSHAPCLRQYQQQERCNAAGRVSVGKRDIQKEKSQRENLEPSSVGSGILLNPDSIGRAALEFQTGDFNAGSQVGKFGDTDSTTGNADERQISTQSRLGRMVNGFPLWLDGHTLWQREPEGVPRVTERTDGRAPRLKSLGNAVCPPQVYPILKCIADIELCACNDRCVFDLQQ